MTKTILAILSLLFPFLLSAQNKTKTVPLGHYDKVYLGMTVSEAEQAYNIKIEKTQNGIIFNANKYNLETSHATINLEEIGKVFQLKDLEFNEMHLEFINRILVEIKFTTNAKYIDSEEKAKEIVNYLKWLYSSEYKGYKEYSPASNVVNNYTRSIILSEKKFISQRRGSEAKWNVHWVDIPANDANLLHFSYAIKAPRKIKNPWYGGNYGNMMVLKMKYNDEISYWSLFVKLMKKSQEAGLKPINTFRNKNLGMSLIAFKETYANTLVQQEPQKVLNSKYAPYVKVYTLSDEKLSLLNHKLTGVYYVFYEDKLQEIRIPFEEILSQDEFNKLREDIKTVFGKPTVEIDEGYSETDFWAEDQIKKNFGEDYFTSLKEDLGEIPFDHLAALSLDQTNLNRDVPTNISIRLPYYQKLDEKAKKEKEKTLQNDF